jgi:UDP-glucuronate 4-epimerase
MTQERFLVTGALGCIGAWTVKRLADEVGEVWAYDLASDAHRLRLIMSDEALAAKVHFVTGDVTAFESVEAAIVDNAITHIVHLAALQVPLVRADPLTGARVNVVGMANVLEAARRHHDQVHGLSFASSIAVYGAPELYPPGPLAADAPLLPATLYGVYKQANEGMARLYWEDFGVGSMGLRPATVYGPGRDTGLTSGPSKAMLALAAGRNYKIGFGGRSLYQHASDVAGAFMAAARASTEGAATYTLGGTTVRMADAVQVIEACVPGAAGWVEFEDRQLPFPFEVDSGAVSRALPGLSATGFEEGVRASVEVFKRALVDGRIDVERALA